MFSHASFAVDDGYLHGLCLGFKNSLLKTVDYMKLVQCRTLDDFRVQLQNTSYGTDFMAEEVNTVLTIRTFEYYLDERLQAEFFYMRTNAVGNLSNFLNFMSYYYMIDNVLLILIGTLHKKPIEVLLKNCHPFGQFDQIETVYVATTPAELYNAVLIDTPIGKYFMNSVSAEEFSEINFEIIHNRALKEYFEDFYQFCCKIGTNTKAVMADILEFEADRRSVVMTFNSFDTSLNSNDLYELYPRIGKLYKCGALSALSKCESFETIKEIGEYIPEYFDIFEAIDIEDKFKTLEDQFFQYEASLNTKSFLSTNHYGIFYSYIKLRQQEIRNLIWISECIAQGQIEHLVHYVSV